VLATEFLSDLVRRLEGRDLPYALVGSIAAMSYGEPRATLHVDVVVVLNGSDLEAIGRLFPPPAFYLGVPRMHEELSEEGVWGKLSRLKAAGGEKQRLLQKPLRGGPPLQALRQFL